MIDRHSHLFCRGSPYSQNIAVYCQGWHKSEVEIVASLEREIRAAITDGFQTFISGMARGVDIWAAEVVLRLRDNGSPIHLIAASPYQGFERAWSPAWQSRYASVLVGADIVRFVSLQYDRGCFQRRNEWMVDHAGRVIAVFNGEKGGTKNTIDYADRQNVPVIYIP
ncbi:MAG: SLOG family protein [Acutalibacteraceae bacterium]|uniref:SLOG family protein n=1 Tax=Emergencia timonensis TaxID=1776384 RepID=UPI00266D302F|nr:SLOG family protein [Emergencia timonensis]